MMRNGLVQSDEKPNSSRENNVYEIRAATETDLHYLIDIDVKCFYRSWSTEKWKSLILADTIAYVLSYSTVPVGFVSFSKNDFDGQPCLRISKIAIKSAHRGRDFASEMLMHVVQYAQAHNLKDIVFTIGEDLIYNSGPYNIQEWVRKSGFKAVSITPDIDILHGKSLDGINYVLELKEVKHDSYGIVSEDNGR